MKRVYREAFTYHIGNVRLDVDELRHLGSWRDIMDAVRKLQPRLTWAEREELLRLADGFWNDQYELLRRNLDLWLEDDVAGAISALTITL